jgi:hypothetical protein
MAVIAPEATCYKVVGWRCSQQSMDFTPARQFRGDTRDGQVCGATQYHSCMDENELPMEVCEVAELVRKACVQVALDAYERALGDGLCAEGAFECAIEAIRDTKIDTLVKNRSQLKAR